MDKFYRGEDNVIDAPISTHIFVDDFMKNILRSIEFALEHPTKSHSPNKKRKLSVSEIVTLTLFRHFTGHSNIKSFYRHIRAYHGADFSHLPEYQNFVNALNELLLLSSDDVRSIHEILP
jgi:hypothetical protein